MAKIKIETSKGDIIIRLYDDTPKHRDNMLKLVNEGYYNGTLFHRVIKDFMIQGGDPDSRNAPKGKMLGAGGPDYTIEAEISPNHFHKYGALAAARLGDEVNPNKESSGCQFYIVTGEKYNQGQLKQMERQLKQNQETQNFNDLVTYYKKDIMEMRKNRDRAGLQELQERLMKEAKEIAKQNPVGFSDEQIEAYTTIGGTPFLDREYTVFGEVEKGLDIIEAIQNVETDKQDRPTEDISMNISVIQ